MYESVRRFLSVALLCVTAALLVLILVSPSYSGLGPALPAADVTLTPWAYLPLVAREIPPAIEITEIYVHDGILPANYEYVVISNRGDSAQSMQGWKLTDRGPEFTYFFPDWFTLQPGASVTLYTRSGNDTQEELFWGNGTRIWDKDSDTAYLYNQSGELVDTYSYPASEPTPTATGEPVPTATASGDPPVIEITEVYMHDGILPANYEYVVISNTGGSAQSMQGWKLTDRGPEFTYFFPNWFTLQPGASVTLYTRSGNDTQEELFWGNGTRIWDKDGDTAYLYNQNSELVDTYSY